MNDELMELPEGWEWATAENLSSFEDNAICAGPFGTIFKAKDFRESGIPIIFLRHVGEGQYLTHKPGFMDEKKWEEIFKPYSVYGGELLITKLGEPPGVCAIYPEGIGPAMVTPDVIKMTVNKNAADSTYLMYYLNSEGARRAAFGIAYGATRLRMNLPIFRNLDIPLAPLNEQKRIVAQIEALRERSQKAKAALEAIPELCDRFRQSVLAAAFRGDLTADWREGNSPYSVDQEFIDAEKDDKGWVIIKAEDVCNVQSGSTPKGKPFTETGDIPYLKVYNIVDQKIDFDYRPQFIPLEVHQKELKRSITLPGDVLMNIVGPPLGKVAIVTDQFGEWNINQALVLFRPKPGLVNRYLYYFLRGGNFIREINNETKGSVGQVNISLTQCRQCLIPVPSKVEQEEIVRRIEILFKAIDAIEKQHLLTQTQLDRLNQSILAKAFRGELVDQDPNDEPASVLLERIRAERAAQQPAKKSRAKGTGRKKSE